MTSSSERALILAPVGRDAALAAAILSEAKIDALPCENVPDLVTKLRKGAGFAMVAEEAFRGADLLSLSAFLKRQPEWSDIQFILLTFRGGGLERNPAAARLLEVLGNVTFLERPFHPTTLVSLAQAALRGRRRQYEARNRLIAIRESEQHVQLLLREVNHRSKNMLSLVRAIANLTASTGAEDFVQRFSERIQSLSAAQDLLIKHKWKAVPFADLIRLQLSHFADLIGRRIALSGPASSISQSACQTLSMALHELATNAAKYGALSTESGSIAIAWHLQADEGAQPKFTLSWVERGGPSVAKPQRRGFGSKVTTKMVESSVGGEVSVDYTPSGLIWRLECPALNIIDGRSLPDSDQPSVRAAGGQRVLVVEDEPLIAAEIAAMLEQAGFEIIGPAACVTEALSLLERENCDTAVLDVNLGRETSEPVAQVLIRNGTPFVVISGYTREQLPGFFRAVPLVQKPSQPFVLRAEIERCLVTTSAMS